MRIGVDVRPLQNQNRFRGIGKYTEALTRAMAQVDDGHRYVLYVDPALPAPELDTARMRQAERIPVPVDPATRTRYLRRFVPRLTQVRPSPDEVDVFLQTDGWGGVPDAVPTVAVFHDAIPLIFTARPRRTPKALVGGWLARWHNRVLMRSYGRAARVVAISESSRRDLLRFSRVRDERVRVVHSAAVTAPGGATDPGIFDELGLGEAPYLLYVGGIDPRKNTVQLLRDYRTLRVDHPQLRLVIVGKEFESELERELAGWNGYLRRHPEIADGVVLAGFVSDAALTSLYGGAGAFVFPSRYEGFGLPVLEAMQYDCPVVCYDNSCLSEVAGEAAQVVPDGTPMASSIAQILDDPTARERLVTAGREQAACFTWERTAGQVLALLEELNGMRGRPDQPLGRAGRRLWNLVFGGLSRLGPLRLSPDRP